MAKKKWKYKFVSEEKFEEYSSLKELELVALLKEQSTYSEQCIKAKMDSEDLKSLSKLIKEHRKHWEENNAEEVEKAKQVMEELKKSRDEDILEDLETKKAEEGAYNDNIKGAREHIDALLFCLRFFR